jgi:hypothetical protein
MRNLFDQSIRPVKILFTPSPIVIREAPGIPHEQTFVLFIIYVSHCECRDDGIGMLISNSTEIVSLIIISTSLSSHYVVSIFGRFH